MRLLPHRRRIVRHRGQRLLVDPRELSGFYLYYEAEYDDHVFDHLATEIGRFVRVIDIGANVGVYTCWFAHHVQRVDAFEPEPRALAALRTNLALNGHANVAVHDSCVSDTCGTVLFLPPPRENLGLGRMTRHGDAHVRCNAVTLDSFTGGRLTEPTLVKIDIEGAELLALRGARNTLSCSATPVAVLLEVHPAELSVLGGTVEELYTLLRASGFRVLRLFEGGLFPDVLESPGRFWWAVRE